MKTNIFHVMTVSRETGHVFWSEVTHETLTDAVKYARVKMRKDRRILVWKEVGDEIHLTTYLAQKDGAPLTLETCE